jgi:NADH-quinone oxidoreductase subunit C
MADTPESPLAHDAPTALAAPAAPDDLTALAARFGAAVLVTGSPLGQPTALIDTTKIAEVALYLRDTLGYQLLLSVTAVDFLDRSPRFHVVYHLRAMPPSAVQGDAAANVHTPGRFLRLKVPVTADAAVVPTLTGVYPTADYHERETWDMFGIEFAGHPDLRRILRPDEFEGHPLRKDFPLQYEEIAFSFNQAEVHAKKPRARS